MEFLKTSGEKIDPKQMKRRNVPPIPSLDMNSTAHIISKLVQQASLLKLRQMLGKDNLNLFPAPESITSPPGHWLSITLIAGPEFKITLKIFYKSSTIRAWIGNLRDKKYQLYDLELFIRDYSQVETAWIRSHLENAGIKTHVWPPLVVRGFDHFFFNKSPCSKVIDLSWYLKDDSSTIFRSMSLEIINLSIFEKLMKISTPLKSE